MPRIVKSGGTLLIAALVLLFGWGGTAKAAPPPGTVESRYIYSVDTRPIYGIGFNPAFVELPPQGSNPTGAYYKAKVQEGYIYRVRTYNWRTQSYSEYWAYSWNSAGQMAPYDVVREWYTVGARINRNH